MPKSKTKMCYVNHTALQKHREKPNFLFLCHYYCLSKNTNSVFNSFWHRDRKNAKFLCQIGESKADVATLCKLRLAKMHVPLQFGPLAYQSGAFASHPPYHLFLRFRNIFRYFSIFSDIFSIFFDIFPIYFVALHK